MRTFLTTAILALALALACAAQEAPQAVDADWLRTWESLQRNRPSNLRPTGRITPANESGTPLVIHGRVFSENGKPRAYVEVFAYQTDHAGVYDRPGSNSWRLRGWAETDGNGRFEFRTIRPGSYPNTRNPAHVHFTIQGPGLPRRWVNDLNFADDPLLSAADAAKAAKVTVKDGVQHVDHIIRITDAGRF